MGVLAITAMLVPLASARQSSLSVGTVRTPHYTEEGSAACLRCHSGDKMHAMAASPHGKLNNPESPVSSHGCESCHGPGSFHVSRAHGGKGFPAMTTFGRGGDVAGREQQLGACLVCHAEGSGDTDLIIWRGSVHDRNNFNCSSCHLVHVKFDPIKEKKHQDKICFKCHRKQKSAHPEFENKSIDLTVLSCSTCHDVHNTMKVIKTQELKRDA